MTTEERIREAVRADLAEAPDADGLWEHTNRRIRRRRRRRWSGGAATLLLVILAAAAGLWALQDPRGVVLEQRDGPGDEQTQQEPSEAQPVEVEGPDGQSERAEALPELAEPTGSLVVATRPREEQMVVLDVDTGELTERRLRELAPGDPAEKLIGGARLIFYGATTIYAMDPDPDAEPEAIVQESTFAVFVPSGHTDRVWVRPGRTDHAPAEVYQIDVHGNVLRGPTETPGGNLAVGLRDQVVLSQRDGQDTTLVVWDPKTDEVVTEVAGTFPMGTDGERFAWCDVECQDLYVTDPAADRSTRVATSDERARFSGRNGTMSPNGRYLATPICDESRSCALAVIDLQEGRSWTVLDQLLPSTSHVGWGHDSQRIFAYLPSTRTVAVYQPGDAPHQIATDLGPEPFGFGVATRNEEQ